MILKRYLITPLIAILLSFSTILFAQDQPPVQIDLTQVWTPTNIQVLKGQPITVNATGMMNWFTGSCNGQCVSTPSGQQCSYTGFAVQGLECWSLIGKVGQDGAAFEVGTSLVDYAAPSSGELFLGVNDTFYPDNTGTWTATVSLNDDCKPKESATVSDMPFAPQEQGNWCWAAVTQMLMENATGSRASQYSQCSIVNAVIGAGADSSSPSTPYCCSHASSCNTQKSLSLGLATFNYQCSSAGAGLAGTGFLRFSRRDIKKQISCHNRALGFQWADNYGNRHDMVIYGYRQVYDQLILSVYDPQAAVHKGFYKFDISYDDLLYPQRFTFEGFCYNVAPISLE